MMATTAAVAAQITAAATDFAGTQHNANVWSATVATRGQ